MKIKPAAFRTLGASLVAAACFVPSAHATDVTGTVSFTGTAVFDQPIAGIDLDDLTASTGPGIEATGNGENCSIDVSGSAPVAIDGTFPEVGTLSATITIGRGGMNPPDGTCLLQLKATGNDGGTVSARGTVTIEVTLANIQGNETVAVPEPIVVRQSKTQAGLSKDCIKWVKKEIKLKGKCNYFLWKLGGVEGPLKCKNAGIEPPDCDPANYVDEVVALSFGQMDQQTDPPMADAIDLDALNDQSKCQRFIGKAAANFIARRNQLVQKLCVDDLADTEACRQDQGQEARAKLSVIDNCPTTDQGTDMLSGLTIPDVDDPCRTDCITAGTIDRNCLKDCFELELGTLSDGVMGDVPECGNGVVQAGEVCDDGNNTAGDCCSPTCGNENLGDQSCGTGICSVTVPVCVNGEANTCTPGAPGVEAGNCADTLDNDCDGLVDGADAGDCPP